MSKKPYFIIDDSCDFPGVYCIMNLDNGKVYVGSSVNIKGRLHQHKTSLHSFGTCKKMCYDYYKGNHFIGFCVVRVPDGLTAFQREAVEMKVVFLLSAADKEKGYNTREWATSRTHEIPNDIREKVAAIEEIRQADTDRKRREKEIISRLFLAPIKKQSYIVSETEKKRKVHESNQKYNNNIDRINITLPKGQKERIKKVAQAAGMSLSAYLSNMVIDAIQEKKSPA